MATAKSTTTTASARKTDETVQVEAKVNLPEMRKPLFAAAGAAEVAVEKLRELPGSYADEIKRLSGLVGGLQSQVKDLPNAVGGTVRGLPTQVSSGLSELSDRAVRLYGDLAERGEKRVSGIRRSPATKEAVARTRTAVSQTKAARTSTRRAADAVGKAAGNASGR